MSNTVSESTASHASKVNAPTAVGPASAALPAPVVTAPAPAPSSKAVSTPSGKTAKSVRSTKSAKPTTPPAAAPVAKLKSAVAERPRTPTPKSTAKPAKPTRALAKPGVAAVAAKTARTAETAKPTRAKEKLVRDSFTMPIADFALIALLKERALGFKRATKKSELLRAGLQALATLSDAQLQAMLDKLPALKAGRPRKAG